MTMPTSEQIREKALELYYLGLPISNNLPEDNELRECGIWNRAQAELMRSPKPEKQPSQEMPFGDFEVDIDEIMKSGLYISGTTGSGKSDIAMYVADKLREKRINVITFDNSQDWLERSNIMERITVSSPLKQVSFTLNNHDTIYDISELTPMEQQMLVEAFCEVMYKNQAMRTVEQRHPYFIIFEESQIYMPQGCMRAKRFQNTVRLLTQGRNYKVRFGIITQFASMVDKDVMKYMKIRYFGWTSEKNDVEYVQGFIGDKAHELKTLESGQFFYSQPDQQILRKIKIKPHKRITSLAIQPIHKPLACTPQAPQASAQQNSLAWLFAIVFFIAFLIVLVSR